MCGTAPRRTQGASSPIRDRECRVPPELWVPRPGAPRQRPPAASRLSWCHQRPAHLGGNCILLVREQGARGHPRGAAAPLPALLSGQSFLQPPACKPSGASGPPALSPLLLLLFSRKSSYFMCRCSSLANWLGTRRRKCQEQPSIGACPRPPVPTGTTGSPLFANHSLGQGAQGWPSKLEGKGFLMFGGFFYDTLAQLRRDAGCQQLDLDPHGCVALPARSVFQMTETQHICSTPRSHLPLRRATPRGRANPPQHQLHGCSSSRTTGTVAAWRDDA